VADCDVDAANLALVLGVKKFDGKDKIKSSEKAIIDYSGCNNCKKCCAKYK